MWILIAIGIAAFLAVLHYESKGKPDPLTEGWARRRAKGELIDYYGYVEGHEPSEEDSLTVTVSQRVTPAGAPTIPADVLDQLVRFKSVLTDDLRELDKVIALAQRGASGPELGEALSGLIQTIDRHCESEALKYDIPLDRSPRIFVNGREFGAAPKVT